MISLIVGLVTGAAGGLLAGHFIKKISLGNLYNGICGILGGGICLLYTSPSPRDQRGSRMPSSA